MAFRPSDWSDVGLPIIRIQNLTDKGAIPNRYNGVVDNKYLIKDGDTLFAWSATIDIFKYKGEDAVLNQHIFKVLSKGDNDINFISHLIKQYIPIMLNESHGSTMKHLTKGTVENCEVKIPCLAEQKRISKVLTDYDNLTSTLDAEIEVLKNTKTQLMNNIFN